MPFGAKRARIPVENGSEQGSSAPVADRTAKVGSEESPSPSETSAREDRAPSVPQAEEPSAGSKSDPADAREAKQPELTEEELVEAAIRAGEEAAEKDMKSQADRAREAKEQLRSQEEVSKLNEELASAREQAKNAEDRLARLQADWENYRRRTANERLSERERAAEKVIEKLLPIVDDMERALDHAKNSAESESASQQATRALIDGVEAIHTKMMRLFSGEGVEVIDPSGEAFDPLEHQAVGRKEDADQFEDTVCDVYQRGYRIAKKVIRPAMVTVSFGGKKRPDPDSDPKSSGAESGASPEDGGARDEGGSASADN